MRGAVRCGVNLAEVAHQSHTSQPGASRQIHGLQEKLGTRAVMPIDLAHDVVLTVEAEGVESAAIHDALRALGCDAVQGDPVGPAPAPVTAPRTDAPAAYRCAKPF